MQQKETILIIGQGHSGSTLLDSILDMHTSVIGVGELFRYKRAVLRGELCGCGKSVSECSFWRCVLNNAGEVSMPLVYQTTGDFLRNTNKYVSMEQGTPALVHTQNFFDEHVRMYDAIRFCAKKTIIVDSSKSPDKAALLINHGMKNVRIIHLVRDGRGVAYSYVKKTGKPFLQFAREWFMTNVKVLIVHRRYPDVPYLRIQYARLAAHPEETIRQLVSWYGASFEEHMLSFREKPHHQIGGNVKLKKKTDDTIRFDDAWKREITMVQRIVFLIFFGIFNWWLLSWGNSRDSDSRKT